MDVNEFIIHPLWRYSWNKVFSIW